MKKRSIFPKTLFVTVIITTVSLLLGSVITTPVQALGESQTTSGNTQSLPDFASHIPPFTYGKLKATTVKANSVVFRYAGCENSVLDKYYKILKKEGWEPQKIKTETGIFYKIEARKEDILILLIRPIISTNLTLNSSEENMLRLIVKKGEAQ